MQIKFTEFWFFILKFKFLEQSVPGAQPDCSVISILEYFWNVQELYPEVYLQFMDTGLFECSNVQIFGFSYLSSSFYNSPYQMHFQIVQ